MTIRCYMGKVKTLGLAVAMGCLAVSTAEARLPCASDGPPLYPDRDGYGRPARDAAIEPTALVTLLGVPWSGRDSSRLAGDAVGGAGLELGRARLGLCGGQGPIAFRLVYEPWDALERSRPDANRWGRIVDASLAWLPYDWLAVRLGMGKVGLGRGREQPDGALPLALLPYSTAALMPDRRAGLAAEADLGVLRLAGGVYQGGRSFDLDALGGLLAVGRVVAEPFGPVGRRVWPEWGEWTKRARPALGVSAGYRWPGPDTPSGYMLGGDLALAFSRVFIDGELLYAVGWPLERPSQTPSLGRRLGAYLEALVALWPPYLSLAARGEYFDEDLDRPTRRFVAFGGGANLYLLGPALALQATYTRKLHLDAPRDDDAIILALTVAR